MSGTLPSDANSTGRDLGKEELELLRQVIESGTLNGTRGTQVPNLEEEFAALYGAPHARAVASGTAAVHVALAALDLEPGDEVISTTVTDIGGIAPILFQQAIPIFADVDPVTLNVTRSSVAERITRRTRAIIVTHLFGNPCDVLGIRELAESKGIPVIEDCAQAYLATTNGRLCGTIGEIGAFSLQQGKHMTCGEGGLVISADDELARNMRLFSDKAWGYGDPNPDHYFLALNYRMSELQAAVARAQLAKLTGVVQRRQASAAALTTRLGEISGLTLPAPAPGATHVYWKYPLLVDPTVLPGGADALGAALRDRDVACVPRYVRKPAFECEVFAERKTFGRSHLPWSLVAEPTVYDSAEYPGTRDGLERVVVLPWNEFYTSEHIEFIASAIEESAHGLIAEAA